MRRDSFIQQVFKIALPVALQCMLQSSFSIVDQIMVGSLGSVSVAAVGIAGKLSTLYSVVIGAVVSVAGIILSQYLGANDNDEADRGFSLHTLLSIGIGVVFMAVCLAFPVRLMGLYSADGNTVAVAAKYLRIIAFGFLPYAVSMMTSVRMRCMEKASLPLVCSIISSLLNTVLNYLLIFGKLGFPAMGANGAATATVISQGFNALLMVAAMKVIDRKRSISFKNTHYITMTLTYPVQGLTVGALSGIAQAAGILIGKELGKGEKHSAYQKSRRLLLYGLIGSFVIAALTVLAMGVYTDFYNVEEYVKSTARQILIAFVVVLPVKVLNMILGGGIVRSGGQTRTMMIIELLGTWGFGVPLALLGAYVWKLSIPLVYFILSMEECVRLLLTWIVFVRKNWMKKL